MDRVDAPRAPTLEDSVRDEQVREHYAQLPAMAIAPTAGGLFTAWVLWDAVDARYLVIGMTVVVLLSAARLALYRRYSTSSSEHRRAPHWRRVAVAAAFVSGCVWGSAAPFLYPPLRPEYGVYLVVLLTLLPIIPVAALAAYMPAFYAYYLPCLAPFVITLALRDSRAERLTALLLVFMMLAMLVFAHRYSRSLAEANRLREQVARKSDALEAAIEHKTRFIAAASHDLRQPVHAMGLFLEVLRHSGDARIGSTRIGHAVDHLEAAQRGLRGMLGNMLDISKLDAGVVQPKAIDFPLAGLLRQLRDEFAPQAAAKGLEFRCRPGDAIVHSDPALLERVVRNLLSNALKYTARGGVLLACRRAPRGVSIQVIDTGIGVPPEQTRVIFEAFARVEGAERSDADGMGLGLAIVRQTADLLGHPLRLRSVPGRGSMFALDVPRGSGQAVEADRGTAAESSRLGPRPGATAAATGSEDVAVHAPRMPQGTVLVVDDDRAVREGTTLLLEQWGLRTLACASIESALVALADRARRPDLALIDVTLAEGKSGLAGVSSIRRATGRDTPVILVTGDTAPGRIREAVEHGHFLLHKPVEPMVLRVCVCEALSALPSADAPRATG